MVAMSRRTAVVVAIQLAAVCGALSAIAGPVGPEFRINSHIQNVQTKPDVARLSNGGFVVAWESNLQDGSQRGVYGQRFNAGGARVEENSGSIRRRRSTSIGHPSRA
jgi:hypothetical protein